MQSFIEKLWSATREGKPLTRRARFFWGVLKLVRHGYVLGLLLRHMWHSFFKVPRAPYNIPVIAVGNLSLGGTGKSVFVRWLVQHGGFSKPAVLLRGYKSPVLLKQATFVVSDGKNIFGNAVLVGDEPLQAAQPGVSVAIGKNRSQALSSLLRVMDPVRPDVVILDDGYQTNTIRKTCTILLVDAQAPLENGYLFPAGPLRELDYHRADIIILTHADRVNSMLEDIKRRYFSDLDPGRIMAGRHAFVGFFDASDCRVLVHPGAPVVLCSGIAKPHSLEITVRQQNSIIIEHLVFFDHHAYVLADVRRIIDQCKKNNVDICITTEKDWTKLRDFQPLFIAANIQCFVTKIAFEFLTVREYAVFANLLQKVLERDQAAK